MLQLLFILSFILNSMGTITITYLVYYQYKYKSRILLFLIASLIGLLCAGISYSIFILNLSALSFEQFRTVFFAFFSLGMLSFVVFFYFYLRKRFALRSYRFIERMLLGGYFFSIGLVVLTVVLPLIWFITLAVLFCVFLFSSFLALNKLVFLLEKLQFEQRDVAFRLLVLNLLLIIISVLGEITYYFLYEHVSDFSLALYVLIPLFFFSILKNQSIYYQQQTIENPDKIRLIFEQFGLSAKEQEIALEVLQGKSNKEIAYDMELSGSTVKSHIYSIYKKVNVQSRVQFVNLVMLRM
ncbi:MAG: helix-turn-helix transcriptional regulator [Spirochaetia bacterium]